MNDECDRVARLLGPLFDGRLSAPVRGALLQHLRECLSCLDAARAIKRLALEASRSPRPIVADDFVARVRTSIEARKPNAFAAPRPLVLWRRIPRATRVIAFGAAAMLVLIGVFAAGYVRGRSSAADVRGVDSSTTVFESLPYFRVEPSAADPHVEPAVYRRDD